jgi:hypothetical protein
MLMVNWSDNLSINVNIPGNYPLQLLIITQLFLAPAQKFRSTKIKHCHDNFCRYAGLDGKNTTISLRNAGDFEYSIDGTYPG